EQPTPSLRVHALLDPVDPPAANYLLLPPFVWDQLAFTDDLKPDRVGLGILVDDVMEEDPAVVSIYREVVALFEIPKTLITPRAILVSKAVFLYSPPAAFRAGFTEEETDSLHFFRHSTPSKSFSLPNCIIAKTVTYHLVAAWPGSREALPAGFSFARSELYMERGTR